MDKMMPVFLASILKDHGEAITAILLIIAGALGWLYYALLKQSKSERDELIKMFQHQIEADRKELITIIDQYHTGQINVVQAINEIKILIATIGAKL
jgi:hypothetical protein